MDWFNWAVRAATIVGGLAFFVFFFIGVYYAYYAYRSALEIWAANNRWLRFQRQDPKLQDFMRKESINKPE